MQSLINRFLILIWSYTYNDIWYRRRIAAILKKAKQRDKSIAYTVRLLSNFPGLWRRTIEQTPNGSGQWGKILFVAEGEADLYLVLNSTLQVHKGRKSFYLPSVPPEQIWGLHMEPAAYVHQLGYDDPQEHDAISRFYTTDQDLLAQGGKYHPSPPYVHFITGKSWDFLNQAQPQKKTYDLGIICSGLRTLEGHRKRLMFLDSLEASNIPFAIWGRGDELKKYRGYKGFALSKWNAHSICKYSIVLENSVSPLYWSEKLGDCLLSFSHPIYYGAPDVSSYFPKECFTPIDIESPSCIPTIKKIISSNTYESSLPYICEARNAILHHHNLHAFISREIEKHFHILKQD